MTGKTCLITGATLGIGKVTALELAKLGARVVLVARNRERGEAVVDEIKREAKVIAAHPALRAGAQAVELLLADLSSLAEIRKLAAAYTEKHDRLDVLINNAGAINMTRKLSSDGLELTFAVNHLAYFLLTHLLLPVLQRTGKPGAAARIVNVASMAHTRGHLSFDDLQSEKSYAGFRVYGTSKLMNIMYTYELARRLEGQPVTANSVHPGAVKSGFGRNDPGWFKLAVRIATPFLLTPENGAKTQIWAASAPEIEGVSGKFFAKCKEARSNRESHDEAAQKQLWAISEKLAGLG